MAIFHCYVSSPEGTLSVDRLLASVGARLFTQLKLEKTQPASPMIPLHIDGCLAADESGVPLVFWRIRIDSLAPSRFKAFPVHTEFKYVQVLLFVTLQSTWDATPNVCPFASFAKVLSISTGAVAYAYTGATLPAGAPWPSFHKQNLTKLKERMKDVWRTYEGRMKDVWRTYGSNGNW